MRITIPIATIVSPTSLMLCFLLGALQAACVPSQNMPDPREPYQMEACPNHLDPGFQLDDTSLIVFKSAMIALDKHNWFIDSFSVEDGTISATGCALGEDRCITATLSILTNGQLQIEFEYDPAKILHTQAARWMANIERQFEHLSCQEEGDLDRSLARRGFGVSEASTPKEVEPTENEQSEAQSLECPPCRCICIFGEDSTVESEPSADLVETSTGCPACHCHCIVSQDAIPQE